MMTVAHLDEQKGLRGGEQQASWLVRGLAGQGVRNLVIGRPGEAFVSMNPDIDSLERLTLPLRGELDLHSAWRLAGISRQFHVDIIHAHTSHAHGIAVLAGLLGAPSRIVVSRRVDFMPKKHIFNRWKYSRADRILCVSQKVTETLGLFGLHSPQVRTVHSAVDEERANMLPVSRIDLGIPEGVPLLFSAGSLVEHKDHANLLQAFALVRREIPEARLCIAGDGPLREALESQRRRLGLEESVDFLGYRKDAPGITRSADVYVSSSQSEGLGTSILEALASGTPVVAAEAGGAREMVVPCETGYLVPTCNAPALAAAIVLSLNNREDTLRMAHAARALVRDKFSVERMVSGTFDAYLELAG